MTTNALLTPTEVWSAKIFSNGWKKPGLGTADVTEKATGAKLGEIGVASTEDVSAAAAAARKAQEEWAKLPGPRRADVLRGASRLILAHSEEIADQIVRETGSIRAKAQWAIEMTAREFLEAAALASHPQGILRPPWKPGVTAGPADTRRLRQRTIEPPLTQAERVALVRRQTQALFFR
jgi:benzaldehyde dehydrogenase (NAD)